MVRTVVEGTQNSAFEEGLGQIRCVVGALEYERPLLGPCYKILGTAPAWIRTPCAFKLSQ